VRRLPYRPPYDWDAILGFLALRAIPGVELVQSDTYARSIEHDGAHGEIAVRLGARNTLQVTILFPRAHAVPAILERVARIFDLAADPIAIDRHLSADPRLAPLVAAHPGLRVPGAWDGFELAIRAILGQQITVVAARKLAGRLVTLFGTSVRPGGTDGLTHVFPQPVHLADAGLSALGMPRPRVAALSSLAAAAVANPRLFEAGPSLSDAVSRLRALPGIGEWTAQYIAMRQLREPDAFPVADIGLMRALEGEYGRRPTPAELVARAQAWRPWRAYAALHLWTS